MKSTSYVFSEEEIDAEWERHKSDHPERHVDELAARLAFIDGFMSGVFSVLAKERHDSR